MIYRPVLLLLLVFFSATNAFPQQREPIPVIENGYVTRAVSLADFDVNGFPVIAGKKASFMLEGTRHINQITKANPYLGQGVTIYGEIKKKQHLIIAEDVVFHPMDKTALSGIALVERVISPATPGSGLIRLLLRADGYLILVNADTTTSFQKPLAAITDVTTNVWISYHGKPQADGILLADTAAFVQNTVIEKEAKLLDKTDYDPAAVDPDARQNVASKLILGRDPKKIPPYKDAALQARVDRIGTSLIPEYQKKLPDTDLSKVIFRFQLIDDPKKKDALALPSGVILIPFQIVNYLKDDSQLATVLADNIACVLEKQTYRILPAAHKMLAANLAASAGDLLVPGIGTVTSIATYARGKAIVTDLLNQSGRVSLGLLRDAGYDINQAPIAWWLLAADTAEKLPSTPLPHRAANLYKSLGSTWHNYPEALTQPGAPLQTK